MSLQEVPQHEQGHVTIEVKTERRQHNKHVEEKHSHAEEDVVLWTDSQTLPNGAQLCPDVSAQDVGSARGRWEQASKYGPAGKREEDVTCTRTCGRICISSVVCLGLTWWWFFRLRCVPGRR